MYFNTTMLFFNKPFLSPIDEGILHMGGLGISADLLGRLQSGCSDETLLKVIGSILINGKSTVLHRYKYSPLGHLIWKQTVRGGEWPVITITGYNTKYTIEHQFKYQGKDLLVIVRMFFQIPKIV